MQLLRSFTLCDTTPMFFVWLDPMLNFGLSGSLQWCLIPISVLRVFVIIVGIGPRCLARPWRTLLALLVGVRVSWINRLSVVLCKLSKSRLVFVLLYRGYLPCLSLLWPVYHLQGCFLCDFSIYMHFRRVRVGLLRPMRRFGVPLGHLWFHQCWI